MSYGQVLVPVCFQLTVQDMCFWSGWVNCWIKPKVLPEGLNKVSDGGSDSSALKGFFGGWSVGIVSGAVGKACDDEGALIWVEGFVILLVFNCFH